eukprot:gnl/TRDRNA2_/TRDRNA2_130214_c0_seq2.p1 gnl/TRDRNA2_/TRDRNA2_130214_c0~~gnl/TRDRNA2_/TRDRNA2_130214_c0_seq2.p1  ORF type:complete len:237 (-),score=36.44 gnl/TRDRNA2_/TRDRNA2_130214_c0_seq2:289-999(-)
MMMQGYGKGIESAAQTSPSYVDTTEVRGDPNLLVRVGNLKPEVQWPELKDHMRYAGNVEFCKILTEDGTDLGTSKGEACVRYSHPAETAMAIAMLAGTKIQGQRIRVDYWSKDGHGGKGDFFGMKGMKGMMGMMGMKGFGKGKTQVHGDPSSLVYVGNLKYEVKWQDLKDHMKQAGTVEFCKILTEDGTDFGRSKGAACIRYSNAAEAKAAIVTLAETELQGRKILVDHWTSGTPA